MDLLLATYAKHVVASYGMLTSTTAFATGYGHFALTRAMALALYFTINFS